MKLHEIVIARDFSDMPFGRHRADGKHSAQHFTEDFLIPALKKHDLVTVVLDGAFGYGSSFLEEAFGGLTRKGFSKADLTSRLNIVSEDDAHLLTEVWSYIKEKD